MKRNARRQRGKASLEVFEEAFHLLRSAPSVALANYYLGTLPFVLGSLWFWSDMSRSPFAYEHLDAAALGMASLFAWMKFWHVMYVRALRRSMTGAQQPLTPGAIWRIAATQVALQPTGLLLLPLASIPTLPFPYVFAFYQNLTALDEGEPAGLGALVKRAARQAALWPRQNAALLVIASGFGLIVFLNWATFCFLLPGLIKILFGVESIFTRSGMSMLNTTFFAAMFGLTYLCVDPLVKAAYALRCFYGESLVSGEDLKAELRQFAPAGVALLAALGTSLVLGGAASASEIPKPRISFSAAAVETTGAQPPSGPQPTTSRPPSSGDAAPALSTSELDRAIQEVLQHRKYTWRMPRERGVKPDKEQNGIISRFLQRVGELLRRGLKAFFDALGNLLRKLFQGRRSTGGDVSGYGWLFLLKLLPYLLIAAVAAGLGFLLYRVWLSRRRREAAIAAEPIRPAPDLSDENVGAEQLPEDGWTKLARELLAQGELRLAMRAFYLASLARLSERNLISLARFKSNRDYERELRRRGHSFPDLLAVFSDNVSVFERTWYGMHEVSGELVTQFAANVDRMRSGE